MISELTQAGLCRYGHALRVVLDANRTNMPPNRVQEYILAVCILNGCDSSLRHRSSAAVTIHSFHNPRWIMWLKASQRSTWTCRTEDTSWSAPFPSWSRWFEASVKRQLQISPVPPLRRQVSVTALPALGNDGICTCWGHKHAHLEQGSD